MTAPNYPVSAASERIVDGTVHALGVGFALIGGAALMVWAMPQFTSSYLLALAVYTGGLIATFVASALYHLTPWGHLRPTLRRIDHAMIYLMIAGTFTPLVAIIATPLAYSVLGLVWAIAIVGIAQKLFFWRSPGKYGPALYIVMGWLGVLLMWDIIPLVPHTATVLMAVGGMLYTVGVVFYASQVMRFSTAIWHGMVVAASACFFAAIVLAVGQMA